jgi:hypothetical protein
MRKAILMMILAVVSSSAAAEWTAVSSNEKFTVYVESATIRKNGNMVEIWQLFDEKTAETVAGITYMSSKDQEEFDCKEKLARPLYSTYHSGNMGRGEIVFTNETPGNSIYGNWTPVMPGTIIETLWKFACGKL